MAGLKSTPTPRAGFTAASKSPRLQPTSSTRKPGGTLIDALLTERGARPVDFAGWQKINAAEVAAGQGRPREKLRQLEDLLAAAFAPDA